MRLKLLALGVSGLLTIVWQPRKLFFANPGEQTLALRGWLRRFPYWAYGHLLLARLALAQGDTGTAQASAQAITELKGGKANC